MTANSGAFLAACLMRLVMESKGLVVPEAQPVDSPAPEAASTDGAPVQKPVTRAKKTVTKRAKKASASEIGNAKPKRARTPKATTKSEIVSASPVEPLQVTA